MAISRHFAKVYWKDCFRINMSQTCQTGSCDQFTFCENYSLHLDKGGDRIFFCSSSNRKNVITIPCRNGTTLKCRCLEVRTEVVPVLLTFSQFLGGTSESAVPSTGCSISASLDNKKVPGSKKTVSSAQSSLEKSLKKVLLNILTLEDSK